jgi:hypothetical protein
MLDERMVKLARKIQGDLVAVSTHHGIVKEADPPLSICSMNYLRGSALIKVQYVEVEMCDDEASKHERLMRHLARCFVR